jgi:hypothetical protein
MQFPVDETSFFGVRMALAAIVIGIATAYWPVYYTAVLGLTYVACEGALVACRFVTTPPTTPRMTTFYVSLPLLLGLWSLGLKPALRYDAMRTGLPLSPFVYATKSGESIVAQASNQLDTRAHNLVYEFIALTEDHPMKSGRLGPGTLDRKLTTSTTFPLDLGKYYVHIEADEGRWFERLEITQDANGNVSSLVVMQDSEGNVIFERHLP